MCHIFFYLRSGAHRDLHAFPTRRSSDLAWHCRGTGSQPRHRRRGSHCRRCRGWLRSEEHTSELQSRPHLVCRLLLEKKKESPYLVQRTKLVEEVERLFHHYIDYIDSNVC